MNSLWVRQIRGMLGLEMRKSLFSARALPVYFLALVPIGLLLLFLVVAMITGPDDLPPLQSSSLFFAAIYQAILRGFAIGPGFSESSIEKLPCLLLPALLQ